MQYTLYYAVYADMQLVSVYCNTLHTTAIHCATVYTEYCNYTTMICMLMTVASRGHAMTSMSSAVLLASNES